MKKIAIFAALMTLLSAGSAFAESLAWTDTANHAGAAVLGDGKALGKLSANVALIANHDTTGYAIATANSKGTKSFGTSHDSTAIYSIESISPTLGHSDSSAFGTGWSSM